jgi:hypothetical protein
MFMPTATFTLVTTMALATGIAVTVIGCKDALVKLRTDVLVMLRDDPLVLWRTVESAVANAVTSADDAMTEATVLTSGVVMTAMTARADDAEAWFPKTEPVGVVADMVLNATPFACAIADLASSRLVSAGKAYDT